MHKKLIVSSIAGNALEFYDLGVYGFLSTLMIPYFFPEGTMGDNLLISLAVFSIGFLARPVGSILFGHLGDRIGRRYALSHTILIMSFMTLFIGVMPTYDTLGIWAPTLLILARLGQGICAGGEYNGSVIFVFESIEKKRYGFYGGLITGSAVSGFLLAAIVSHLSYTFLTESYQWRVPFILGSLISVVGFYIRYSTLESTPFLHVKKANKIHATPLLKSFKLDKKSILCTMGIGWGVGGYSITLIGYMHTYLNKMTKIPHQMAMTVSIVSLTAFSLFLPLCGHFADKKNYYGFMRRSALLTLLTVGPTFYLLTIPSLPCIFIAGILLALQSAAFTAPMHIVMIQSFPVQRRYSGVSFGYSLGISIFGGCAPMIHTLLIKTLESPLAPTLYLALTSCVGYWAVRTAESLQKHPAYSLST